ncbi:unnamed protein product, partial [marine sediment metagenome]
RVLQDLHGDNPFYLSYGIANWPEVVRVLGKKDKTQFGRWLRHLVQTRMIQLVQKGDRKKRKASTYRYIGSKGDRRTD